MKKILSFLMLSVAIEAVFAQAPQLLNYQAIVRDGSGIPVRGTAVNFQFRIHDSTQTGSLVFSETDTATTNQFGLAMVQIGKSTQLTGVNWGNNNKYLQVGVDITGGTAFADMGTSQLLSVPYALYSGNGANSWGRNGNAGTTYGTNFIGTTDSVSLMFRVKDTVAGRIETFPTANAAFGAGALKDNNNGTYNSAFGAAALNMNTSGNFNTAVGLAALHGHASGDRNTAIGGDALYNDSTGTDNTACGYSALYSNISGFKNTAAGMYSLYQNTTGQNNVAVGYKASSQNTTGYSNVAIGIAALYSNASISNQVAIGDSALYSFSSAINGSQNMAVGSKALLNNTRGEGNTAIGYEALYSNIFGGSNNAIGYHALYFNTNSSNNTANGYRALYNNTGPDNTAVGLDALYNNTTGQSNTAIGSSAGVVSGNLINATAIGSGAIVDSSNSVVLGNLSAVRIGGQVQWTTYSDERVKTNVTQNVPGLTFIKLLQPVTYHYDINKENELIGLKDKGTEWPGKRNIEKIAFSGFIAQQVDLAAKNCAYDFSGVDKNGSMWGLRYSEFVPSIVKSVQELDGKIEEHNLSEQSVILKLQQQIEALQKEITELKKK